MASIAGSALGFLFPRTSRMVQDIGESSRVNREVLPQSKKRSAVLEESRRLAKQAQQETDKEKKRQLLSKSWELQHGKGSIDEPITNFSKDIGAGYVDRGLGVGTELGTLLAPFVGGGLGAASKVGPALNTGAKVGAVSGGLLGLTEIGANPLERLTGGAGGAITGGVVGAVLDKLLGTKPKLSQTGEKLREGVRDPKVKIGPKYVQEKEALSKAASDLGLKGSSSAQSRQMGEMYMNLQDELSATVSRNTDKFATKGIVSTTKKALEGEADVVGRGIAKDQFNKWSQKLSKLGSASAEDLMKMKFELSGQLSPVYKKLAAGNPLTGQEIVKLAFHNSIDDVLKSGIPEAGNILSQMSKLHQLAPGLSKAANSKVSFGIGGLSSKPLGQAVSGGQDILGRLLSGAGTGFPGASQKLTPLLTNLLAGQKDIGGQQAPKASQSTQGLPQPLQQLTQQPQQPQQKGMSQQQLALMILNDPDNADIYESVFKLSGGGAGGDRELPATQAQRVGDLDTSLNLMNGLTGTLQGSAKIMGPVTGRVRGANPWDVDAKVFESEMTAIAQTVGKAMEGGVLRQEDVKKYLKILPQISDTPEIASGKIANVVRMLQTQKQALLGAYSGAGFATGKL